MEKKYIKKYKEAFSFVNQCQLIEIPTHECNDQSNNHGVEVGSDESSSSSFAIISHASLEFQSNEGNTKGLQTTGAQLHQDCGFVVSNVECGVQAKFQACGSTSTENTSFENLNLESLNLVNESTDNDFSIQCLDSQGNERDKLSYHGSPDAPIIRLHKKDINLLVIKNCKVSNVYTI